jgi:hypothetical protein
VVKLYLASPVIQVRQLTARIIAEFLLPDGAATIAALMRTAAAGTSANQIHGHLLLLRRLAEAGLVTPAVEEAVIPLEHWLETRCHPHCFLLRWELEQVHRELEKRRSTVEAGVYILVQEPSPPPTLFRRLFFPFQLSTLLPSVPVIFPCFYHPSYLINN